MDKIDANWIKSRLTGERGEQARLAEAMGIDEPKVSKILAGKRLVKSSEVAPILKFFGVTLAPQADLAARIDRLAPDDRARVELIVDALLGGQQQRGPRQD